MIVNIGLNMLDADVHFVYGHKKYRKFVKKTYGVDSDIPFSGATLMLTDKGSFNIVVGVKKIKNIVQLKGIIIHELSHAVSELMNHYGLVDDEFRSYLLQYMYQEVIVELDAKLLKAGLK